MDDWVVYVVVYFVGNNEIEVYDLVYVVWYMVDIILLLYGVKVYVIGLVVFNVD